MTYDVLVIGAGPGGYGAALKAAGMGLKTAIAEKAEIGGTCLNRGCVPTKALLHASELFTEISHSDSGVLADNVRVDIGKVFAHKDEIVQKLSTGVESLLKAAKIDILRGTAKVIKHEVLSGDAAQNPDGAPGVKRKALITVRVEGNDGEVSEAEAYNLIIATGAVPARPPIKGLDLDGVLTSDDILKGSDHVYTSLVIIGGGVIGVELATFYSELGTDVTVLEGLDRLLPGMDRELGQSLLAVLKKKGVKVCTGAMVESVETCEEGLKVSYRKGEATDSASAETVLCAIGRTPYTEGLFADGIDVKRDGRRIAVDAHYMTSLEGVYAIGDVSSKIQLAHAATAQGEACAMEICGREPAVDVSLIPGCVYCRPEITTVGMTEAEAKEAGIPVKTAKSVLGANARTLIAGAERSFMKLVADAETGVILGAQLMCTNSTDMAGELATAVRKKMTAAELLATVRPHPTFEEALSQALEKLI